jgi:hypothetical protein
VSPATFGQIKPQQKIKKKGGSDAHTVIVDQINQVEGDVLVVEQHFERFRGSHHRGQV